MQTAIHDRSRRYIVVHEQSNRIVASCGGTHAMMERICSRLDRRHAGTYVYDDACEAGRYLPQVGSNIRLAA